MGNKRVPLERPLVPLSFHGGSAHVRVHATKRYHLSRVHRRILAGFPPKATAVQRARIRVETFIQLRSFGGDEESERKRKKKKRKKGTDDRGWLKWINDRRTREKYVVGRRARHCPF